MKCKICKKQTEIFFDDTMRSNFFHCKECEFIFKDEEKIVSNERELKQYLQHNNSEESPGYKEMFEDFISKCVTPYKKNIKNVLEFGCGPGPVLAKMLENESLKVDRYDKFFYPDTVYESKTYDLITSTEVIEHIKDPMNTMKLFNRHLVKNGYLSLMTQFHSNSRTDFLKWWYRRDPTHISFYRPKSFEVLAEIFGFEILFSDSKKLTVMQKS